MKKHDLAKLAILGVLTAGTLSTQIYAQGAGSCAGRNAPRQPVPQQTSNGSCSSHGSDGSCASQSNVSYTPYNPAAPVPNDDMYNGSKGIKQSSVTNYQNSEQKTANTQTCEGTTTPQPGTLPVSLPNNTKAPNSNNNQSVSDSSCSSCSGYSDGSASSPKNSAVLKAKRTQKSSRK